MGTSQSSHLSWNGRASHSCLALLSTLCVFCAASAPAQPADGLFTPQPSFNLTNRLVSVSVFQWFTANGGQLTGPWRPVEGRANWTGTTNFWRTQIKQMMAANFDMLYVHLIPSSEQQRVNLFQALNQLRREGWNVPKVAPFLDPMITWHQQPLVDVATTAGKDEFVSHYIRWFNQYYSVNQDPYADDFLARIDNRPVLDTWHVQFNLSHLSSLSRADVETRLRNAFAAQHPHFTNRLYMVTTALNDPTFAWAEEKVPQFEINEYYREVAWGPRRAAQLKGGYWDQNIRNPGDFLLRAGGVHYSNAWRQVNRATLHRVYVESWNEYDEGTGIYAANPGAPYIRSGSGNTNNDVWSSANDPYEYIKTTARGAAAFNDWPERDAKILWHNLPARMLPGETRTATVIVRNEGDAMWSEAAKFRFGQKEFLDPVLFGAGRYLLNDAQDDIPAYGGIFRGRPKTFTLTLKAPASPGLYTNHWSMVQESVTWFGETLTHSILVDPTPVIHGAPQAIDSTGLLTNRVDDFTEHTYTEHNLAVGSFAECAITRTFAAPIKSLKVTLVSGTADDIGYVGGLLVTPNSFNTTCRLGTVTNEINVSSAVTVTRNQASLTLRAEDSCCCDTGWGEDTVSGRKNAKLHWEVELAPPAPFSPVFTNPTNGHYYALFSPATWTWSERAASALGGHLTTIRNQGEQNWVFNTLASYNGMNRMLWIGFNDVAKEGTFRWASGNAVTFTNWAPGEPNNAVGGEDFVSMLNPGNSQAGRWNDWGERVYSGGTPFNGVAEFVAPMGPPRITSEPHGGKVNPGTRFVFAGAASGSPTLRHQWRLNGVNLPGATNPVLTIVSVQFSNAGHYSLRATNVLGVAESASATLIVNHAPDAILQTVSLDEDTSLAITLGGTDADGDALTFAVLAPPAHGTLSGTPPNLTYASAPNYFGPDSFTFQANDRMALSPPAAVSINVLAVNDPPVAHALAVSASEDTPLALSLTASDADGDTLTYTVVNQPAHGSLSATAPNLTYLAATNFSGTDSFTFRVSDGQTNSAEATVSITVNPVNDPPVAVARISPLFSLSATDTNLYVLSPNNSNAWVTFDASLSSDVENDPLDFAWFELDPTNAFAAGIRATNLMSVGEHTVTLIASDGQETGSTAVSFAVIRLSGAVAQVYTLLEDADIKPRNKQPFYASLDAAIAAFERGNLAAGVNILEAFIQKVQVQMAPIEPVLAGQLIEAVRQIIAVAQSP